jgi:hypothetical protein
MFSRLGPETRDPLEELLQRALKAAHHVAPTLQRFLYDIELDAGRSSASSKPRLAPFA